MGGDIFRTRPDRPLGPLSVLCNGYRVCFLRVKQPGRGVNHPLPSRAEVKERVELYLYSPLGLSRLYCGELSFKFFFPSVLSVGSFFVAFFCLHILCPVRFLLLLLSFDTIFLRFDFLFPSILSMFPVLFVSKFVLTSPFDCTTVRVLFTNKLLVTPRKKMSV